MYHLMPPKNFGASAGEDIDKCKWAVALSCCSPNVEFITNAENFPGL